MVAGCACGRGVWAAESGRRVFIASLAGAVVSAGHGNDGADRAGSTGSEKALCREVGPAGITVNVVAPGAIDTAMMANVPPDVNRRYIDNPVGRIGHVEDVAHMV